MNIRTSEVKLRKRGHNIGLPMLHIEVTDDPGPPSKKLISQIMETLVRLHFRTKWVCIETTGVSTPTGLGTLLNTLNSFGVQVDLHIHNPHVSGNISRSPSWLTKPKTVVVDYSDSGNFSYHSLTEADVIVFEQPEADLTDIFEKYSLVSATKWIHSDGTNNEDYKSLVEDNEGSRLSWVS